jgi:mevalonate kinase
VILLGEHAVVYGFPALAGPLSWGVTATGTPSSSCALNIPKGVGGQGRALLKQAFDRAARACGRPRLRVELTSELPPSMGLGSSAAVSVSVSRLLLEAKGERASDERVLEVALEMESEFHGRPSGVDHTVSARNDLILFRHPEGSKAAVRVIRSPRPLRVLVALAGDRPPTKWTVKALRERQARWPVRYRRLFREIGSVSQEGARAVGEGDLEALGDAMNVNHGLLSAGGLSSASLDEMVHRLRGLGALGAKLTGSGGDGGAVVGLFYEPEPAVAKLTRMGVRCFVSQLAGPRAL